MILSEWWDFSEYLNRTSKCNYRNNTLTLRNAKQFICTYTHSQFVNAFRNQLFSIADEPTVQGVRRASGRLPLRCIHLRGLQGESCHLIFHLSLSYNCAQLRCAKMNWKLINKGIIFYMNSLNLNLNLNSYLVMKSDNEKLSIILPKIATF